MGCARRDGANPTPQAQHLLAGAIGAGLDLGSLTMLKLSGDEAVGLELVHETAARRVTPLPAVGRSSDEVGERDCGLVGPVKRLVAG